MPSTLRAVPANGASPLFPSDIAPNDLHNFEKTLQLGRVLSEARINSLDGTDRA